MKPSEIEDRILSLLDGELSADEVAALEETLRSNPDHLRTYAKLVALQNALETRFGGAHEEGRSNLIPVGRVVARQHRLVLRRSLYAAAAVLLGLAITMAFILAPTPALQVATFRTTPASSYVLSYEGEGEAPEAGRLAVGSRLQVSEGAFEGSFSNGAKLVAEAPCEIRVLAEDRVAVDQGAAWFHVPATAKGFAAETPRLVVVDLGTEFGVITRPGKPDEVHVITGKVEVTPRAEGAAAEVLGAGMARRLGEDGKLAEIDPDPAHFRKELESFDGLISNFSFTGPPWTTDKESNFDRFSMSAPSEDADPYSVTSNLSNHGFSSGGYASFYIRDADMGLSIFRSSATPGVGMNLGGAHQSVPTHYVSFTVTPVPAHETEFRSLSFYTGVIGVSDEYFVELRVADGRGESVLGSILHTSGAEENESVVLKTIDFPDFTSRASVEFRLYAYGVSEPATSPELGGIRFDDIALHGVSRPVREESEAGP